MQIKQKYMSWVGEHDFQIVRQERDYNVGPIYAFFNSKFSEEIDEFHLLHSVGYKENEFEIFLEKIKNNFGNKKIIAHNVKLENPTDYGLIYPLITDLLDKEGFYHIQTSSGTPQMAAIWLLLSKTILNKRSKLYQGYYDSKKLKDIISEINIPFDIEVDFLLEINKKIKNNLIENWNKLPEYLSIIHRSFEINKILNLSYKVSKLDIPVIILGETGVGKELIAKAIHSSSERSNKELITVNCAALNESTIEATLFGWSKGAWTNSYGEGRGLFLDANNGSIFLDEIGELSLNIQAKLLRVLEYGAFNRVGDGKVFKVDVRIIVATNRDLMKMVSENKFRRDLFYRLNVAVIKIPPLKERKEDILLLAEYFLSKQNEKLGKIDNFNYIEKKLSISAKKFIESFDWPGNIRELYHTIERATIWGESDVIDDKLLKSVIISVSKLNEDVIESKEMEFPFNLNEYLDQIKSNYIKKALQKTGGNTSKASKLLGYKNYQTLKNNIKEL
jgi:transcriptional regulator with PAS, ATPase and Fis domain